MNKPLWQPSEKLKEKNSSINLKESDKINIQNLQTDRWFKELVEDFDCSKYLTDIRWNKHWKNYHENN